MDRALPRAHSADPGRWLVDDQVAVLQTFCPTPGRQRSPLPLDLHEQELELGLKPLRVSCSKGQIVGRPRGNQVDQGPFAVVSVA